MIYKIGYLKRIIVDIKVVLFMMFLIIDIRYDIYGFLIELILFLVYEIRQFLSKFLVLNILYYYSNILRKEMIFKKFNKRKKIDFDLLFVKYMVFVFVWRRNYKLYLLREVSFYYDGNQRLILKKVFFYFLLKLCYIFG